MLDYMGVIFLTSGFAHMDNVITKKCSKQSHCYSCQACKATNHTGTLRNPASGTYTSTHRNSPEPSGTFRNLPPEPTRQNPPEPSGTCLWNPPKSSGTFRNLPPEPTPARTGTFRNFPEPSSGTCSCDPHRHTPELISGLKTPLAYAVGEKT